MTQALMMGSDESRFNLSLIYEGQSHKIYQDHKTVSTDHNLRGERGESKRNRTEVLPLINALQLGQSGSPVCLAGYGDTI